LKSSKVAIYLKYKVLGECKLQVGRAEGLWTDNLPAAYKIWEKCAGIERRGKIIPQKSGSGS